MSNSNDIETTHPMEWRFATIDERSTIRQRGFRFLPISRWGDRWYALLTPILLQEGQQTVEVIDLTDHENYLILTYSYPWTGLVLGAPWDDPRHAASVAVWMDEGLLLAVRLEDGSILNSPVRSATLPVVLAAPSLPEYRQWVAQQEDEELASLDSLSYEELREVLE